MHMEGAGVVRSSFLLCFMVMGFLLIGCASPDRCGQIGRLGLILVVRELHRSEMVATTTTTVASTRATLYPCRLEVEGGVSMESLLDGHGGEEKKRCNGCFEVGEWFGYTPYGLPWRRGEWEELGLLSFFIEVLSLAPSLLAWWLWAFVITPGRSWGRGRGWRWWCGRGSLEVVLGVSGVYALYNRSQETVK
jgi:hypothetical protein